MIDLHSHIIHGVDDGPSRIKHSVRMVLEAERLGIKTIFATPHFHKGVFDNKTAAENFENLKNKVSGCGVNIFQGCEVLICPDLIDLIRNGMKLTLGNTKYLLLELPYNNIPVFSHDIIYKLHLENIIPILAHPERYTRFNKDINVFINFIEKGCLVQLDAGSVLGVYGRAAKAFSKKLIQLDLVDFVASDAHSPEDYSNRYLKAYSKILNWAGEEYAQKLFKKNAEMVIHEN